MLKGLNKNKIKEIRDLYNNNEDFYTKEVDNELIIITYEKESTLNQKLQYLEETFGDEVYKSSFKIPKEMIFDEKIIKLEKKEETKEIIDYILKLQEERQRFHLFENGIGSSLTDKEKENKKRINEYFKSLNKIKNVSMDELIKTLDIYEINYKIINQHMIEELVIIPKEYYVKNQIKIEKNNQCFPEEYLKLFELNIEGNKFLIDKEIDKEELIKIIKNYSELGEDILKYKKYKKYKKNIVSKKKKRKLFQI